MKSEFLLAWWNLLYIVPFLVALLYLVLYMLSGLTFGDDLAAEGADADHEVAVDHDADVADAAVDQDADLDHDLVADADHDVDAGIEQDVAGDHDVDHDADVDHEAHSTPVDHVGHAEHQAAPDRAAARPDDRYLIRALSWFGIGRVPLSILLMVLCFSWGFIGFATNNLLIGLPIFSRLPALAVLISLPLALLGSTVLTRSTARLVGKWMPASETYARPRRALVGRAGEALFDIDHEFGMATLRDREGNLHQVSCRVYDDAKPVPKGTRVLLVDYDEQGEFFWVIESDL